VKRSPLKRGTKQLKRTELKRGTKELKRSPLKQGKSRLRSKSYRRTKAQAEYHDENPRCRVCGKLSMPTPHHIDVRKNRSDEPGNLDSLCWTHHIGPEGVHVIGLLDFCTKFGLTEDPKWKEVYERSAWKRKERGELSAEEKESAVDGSAENAARVSIRIDGSTVEGEASQHPERPGSGETGEAPRSHHRSAEGANDGE